MSHTDGPAKPAGSAAGTGFAVRTVEVASHVTVVEAEGELDIATSPLLTDAVHGALLGGRARVVIDLGLVTFLDSSGCRDIAKTAQQAAAAGARVALVSSPANQPVHRVVDYMGLAAVLPTAPTVDDAVEAVAGSSP